MQICGLQKLTLIDFPARVAATVFTNGCNYRCPFCHNPSLVLGCEENALHSEDELFDFLKKRKGVLDGLVISGGEPLLQSDIAEFIEKVKALGYAVKLDTNGYNPDKLMRLIDCKLIDYVAMDIKSSLSGYATAVGIVGFKTTAVEKSVELLMQSKVDYEFRTTVVRGLHSERDLIDISSWIAGDSKYFLQSFIDSGDILDKQKKYSPYSAEELRSILAKVQKNVPRCELRGV